LRKHQEPEESKQGFQLGPSSRSVGLPNSHSLEARKVERPLQGITKVETKQGFQLGSSSRSVGLPNSHTLEARRVERPLQGNTKVESKQGFQLGSSSRSVVQNTHTHEARRVERPLQGITKAEATNQLHGNSVSKKAETTNQLHGSSVSKVCKPLQKIVPVDAKPANETGDDESRRVDSLYKSLLKIQPVTYDGLDSLDQDWLFSSVPKEPKPVAKKQKIDAFQCSKSLWPRAQYMPEVDIYALPYTIPF
jgi:hypothetical protein